VITKTEGIVLRFAATSDTSRMVTWLTPDHGKAATLVKGSQRPKSFFIGQYDLFYTCDLVFYSRDRHSVCLARECYPLKTRPRLRRDWKAAALASYVADLASRICPPNAPHPGLYDLLDDVLDELDAHGAGESFMLWFELKVLEEMGFAPRLQHCLSCNQVLTPGKQRSHFSYARGGILCSRCTRASKEGLSPISPDILATLKGWQRARNPQATRATRSSHRQIQEMSTLLGRFLSYHLDMALPSRAIAVDVLGRQLKAAS
jgi:DNA repair protein RecO (recombination protein O)